jgi:hypothetical protein
VTLKTKSFTEIPSQAQNVQTINLSEGGLCISLNSRIELPSPLLCEFTLLNSPLQFQGEIVWEKIFDDGKYYSGVRFVQKDEHQDSVLKGFLCTNDEYIQQLINNLPPVEKETSEKIETFFREDVKGFVEDLIELEDHIKNKSMAENSIQDKLNAINDEIVKKGDELEEIVRGKILIKEIKKEFRSLVEHWVYKSKIMERALKKSYGYPGDYNLLETIYNNQTISEGMGIYQDRYFLDNPYAIAVRNRKNKMKNLLMTFMEETALPSINILNIACGSCREIRELLPDIHLKKKLKFTCLDFDEKAINYSKERFKTLPEDLEIKFLKESVLKLSKHQEVLNEQNLIYSIGLADYLPDRVLKKIIFFIYSLLCPSGRFIIAHKDKDKYKPLPPDWFCDWTFEPRNVNALVKLVKDSGIANFTINVDWENSNKIFFLIITKMS